MRFVVVTGMSGGGKSTAFKMLEDLGFYCVDNLPVPLIEKFLELIVTPGSEITKVALGLDVRADQPFNDVQKILEKLKAEGYVFEVLFMDASDSVLIKRYKETRRVHPLSPDGRIEDGVEKERKILEDMKRKADYVIDTSNLLTRELKEEMDRIFVRFLPNPFYIDELKHKTGNDQEVQDYVMSFSEASDFMEKLVDMLTFLVPNYIKEGKYQLVVGIGCTGGRHRSVTLANELYKRMKDQGNYGLKLYHRDTK